MSQAHADEDQAVAAESVRRLRLQGFLRELVREEGRTEVAELLGVSDKTVLRAVQSGRLSRRVSAALERLLSSGEQPPGDELGRLVEEQGQQLTGLERRVVTLEKQLRSGLEELRVAAGNRSAERAREGGAARTAPAEGAAVIGLRSVQHPSPRRFAPEVVVAQPEEGDEEVFGAAWPLVEEWRRLRTGHSHQGKGVVWLRSEERLLTLELAMLEEHGLTLPPETQPLRGAGRTAQTHWRRMALEDARRARARAELWRWVRRVVFFGLLLGVSAGAVLLQGCEAVAARA